MLCGPRACWQPTSARLRRHDCWQALELRVKFEAARQFFLANQFLRMSLRELRELERAKLREKERIECVASRDCPPCRV
jgi:hypothetical protein